MTRDEYRAAFFWFWVGYIMAGFGTLTALAITGHLI
jgi:hypothetical protein